MNVNQIGVKLVLSLFNQGIAIQEIAESLKLPTSIVEKIVEVKRRVGRA